MREHPCGASSGASFPRGPARTDRAGQSLISHPLLAQCLDLVSQYVQGHKGLIIQFSNKQKFQLQLGSLDETCYAGMEYMLTDWAHLYLPSPTRMVVLGTVDNVPCLAMGQQLVILVAADGGVYTYEEEKLHRLSRSLEQFLRNGLLHFGEETYDCAEGQEPLSEEERAKRPELQCIRQSAQHLVESGAGEMGKLLDFLES
ncbi:uncharacterized protein LOC102381360 isoform X1 [Alligator sinensis]|uniref:Uncharacterized protein LOC102381360 isoform X1 n=1 Tax=Alligator sinensis TaxID=38654 RepID=A0A1U7S910_ALLSI|nr:uncharacterized protein LOC102381360 isoform X1 [Alligator sinensis]